MMNTVGLAAAAVMLVMSLVGCTSRISEQGAAVPRPTAYPRIGFPDSTFRTVEIEGVNLAVNSGAQVTSRPSGAERGAWIDIAYQCLGSPRLYLTLTQSDDPVEMKLALDNRLERIALNLGSERAELTELTSAGDWSCRLLVARGSLTTPVQILAWHEGEMLSGALTVSLPDSICPDPAAIAPIVKGVERDMMYLLRNL